MLVGVVGKANVGKSTFFKAATLADVLIANYPFATIKPNTGVGFVRISCVDSFFNVQCNPREGFCVGHQRFVPVNMIDVAGLVPGAHEGKGMGNQFLDDLNQADVLIHVVDASGSTNEKGEPVSPGSYNPCDDVKFLEEELDYWYMRILEKGWEKFARTIQQEQSDIAKALFKQLSGLHVTEDMVKEAVKDLRLDPAKPGNWTREQLFSLASYFRKKTKPMVIAANKVDVPTGETNYKRMREEFPHLSIIPCSAESELALREAAKHKLIEYIPGNKEFKVIGQLSEKQQKALEFIQSNVLSKFAEGSGVQQILNSAVFGVLKYMAIFPGGMNKLEDQFGRVLPDCFLMPPKTTALEFAFRIHTDLGNKFIRAIDVKKKMVVGKDHALQHLDVVEIVTAK